ncbi:DUF4442 domain-containing protein [Gallaecimonas sp. GXIMD4217]|uniref:DUF4442 domain-containing protein n=1 Tax=Gallaecimonas sp. GXIMD4217 TaxID=3131927 RepID=UPI00311B07D7
MSPINRLGRLVAWIDRMPAAWRPWLLSRLFGGAVKFAGTAKVRVDSLAFGRAELSIRNRGRVQNHIKGVHAAAMALLGESATGFLTGLHVPDDRVPLLKSMHVDYLSRAKGDLKAVASLSQEQIALIRDTDKGELVVPVVITDEEGKEPIRCEYVWAWVPKRRR